MNVPDVLAIPLAAGADWVRLVGAWCLTYLVHSTLLLGGAWAVSRRLAGRAPRAEEALWRVALLAGFFTASLQLAWPAASQGVVRTLSTPPTATVAGLGQPSPVARPAGTVPGGPTSERRLPLGLAAGAAAAWGLTAATGAGLLALAALALRRRLSGRRDVASPAAQRELADLLDLAGEAPVRLTETPSLAVPIALGVVRREICLPRRVLSGLGEREQRALLAHELAHHARHDPAWLLLARLAETAGGLQPLNRLARRRLVELAEWLADARAVRWTGDPEGLARCLAEVASWRLPASQARLVPGFAAGGHRLVDRVRRLLARRPLESGGPSLLWTRLGGGLAAFALVAFAPGVAPGSFAEASSPVGRVGAAPPAPVLAPAPVAAAQEVEPTPEASPPARPVTIDGRRWSDLSEEERAELHRAVRQAHDVAREAGREAGREARQAAEEARRGMPSADEIARIVAEAERAAAEATAALPSEAELQEILERAFREAERAGPDLEALERELHRAEAERHREMARAMAEVREQLPDSAELARVQEEVRRAMERAHRGLDGAHRQEIARLGEEMRRIHEAIGPQLRELERLGERIGREVESALEGLEAREEIGDAPPPPPPAPSLEPPAAPRVTVPRALPALPARPAQPAPAPAPPAVEPPD